MQQFSGQPSGRAHGSREQSETSPERRQEGTTVWEGTAMAKVYMQEALFESGPYSKLSWILRASLFAYVGMFGLHTLV